MRNATMELEWRKVPEVLYVVKENEGNLKIAR
jgi:hypothetical protein